MSQYLRSRLQASEGSLIEAETKKSEDNSDVKSVDEAQNVAEAKIDISVARLWYDPALVFHKEGEKPKDESPKKSNSNEEDARTHRGVKADLLRRKRGRHHADFDLSLVRHSNSST